MIETLKNIGLVVGPSILRSLGGWAQNAFKDGKVTLPEWKLLGETVIRVGVIGVATYYGLNGAGLQVDALAAGFSALVMDKFFEAIKDFNKGKKK